MYVTLIVFLFLMLSGCMSTRTESVNNDQSWQISAGQHPRQFEETIVKTIGYRLLVYAPEKAAAGDRRWPLIIFLHGSGERGDDVNRLKVHSLPKLVDTTTEFPFIVLSPQCPDGERWNVETLNAMLDHAIQNLPVDTNRMYLTGLSSGGLGVWKFAIAHPERFAAIAPVCGWGYPEDIRRLKDMPVWVFHGAKDDVVPPTESEQMVRLLKKHGNNSVRLTLYPEGNHNAWDATYGNPDLYEWMLNQSKVR